MTVFVSDTFTGSNGASWSGTNWTTGTNSSGTSATIQGNAGRINSGTDSGYTGKRCQVVNYANQTNCEILVDFRFPSSGNTDCYFGIMLREQDSIADSRDGYQFRYHRGVSTSTKIEKCVSYTGTTLTSTSFTVADDTWYTVRFQAIGSSLKAKIWQTSGSEPGSWTLTVTDSTYTGSGLATLVCYGGNASGGYVEVDNFSFSDGSTTTAVSASETSSSTDSAGSLVASLGAAEVGSGAEASPAQSRGAAETSSSVDLGSIASTPKSAGETSSSAEAVTSLVTLLSATEGVLATESGVQGFPPVPIQDYELVQSHDFDRRVGKGPYRLVLPWTEGPRADHRFFRRISVHRGLTLLRINNLFQLIEDPTYEQLTAADRIYIGGYDNWVTDDEAQDLGNAGWADYIEGFTFVPDAFYGAGQYGISFYGN